MKFPLIIAFFNFKIKDIALKKRLLVDERILRKLSKKLLTSK